MGDLRRERTYYDGKVLPRNEAQRLDVRVGGREFIPIGSVPQDRLPLARPRLEQNIPLVACNRGTLEFLHDNDHGD